MRAAVRRIAGAATVTGALAVGLLTATTQAEAAPATVTGYDACPYGKVCLFEGWGGTGQRWDVPGCGNWTVPQWMQNLGVSSVKTYGNAVDLSLTIPYRLGYVPQWTGTNLSAEENDKVFAVHVRC